MQQNWDDTKYAKDGLITEVDHERWQAAQQFEEKCWLEAYSLADDWNFWWKEKFDNYSIIRDAYDGKSADIIEVGCGPFTNVRLIEELVDCDKIVCSDPLINTYMKIPCWIRNNVRRLIINDEQLEKIMPDVSQLFDIVVCINVLDHVENVEACFTSMKRLLKKGGHLIFGQDLTDWVKRNDPSPEKDQDQGHPIRINEEYCKEHLSGLKEKTFKIVESRNKEAHYGCLCYIGEKI